MENFSTPVGKEQHFEAKSKCLRKQREAGGQQRERKVAERKQSATWKKLQAAKWLAEDREAETNVAGDMGKSFELKHGQNGCQQTAGLSEGQQELDGVHSGPEGLLSQDRCSYTNISRNKLSRWGWEHDRKPKQELII